MGNQGSTVVGGGRAVNSNASRSRDGHAQGMDSSGSGGLQGGGGHGLPSFPEARANGGSPKRQIVSMATQPREEPQEDNLMPLFAHNSANSPKPRPLNSPKATAPRPNGAMPSQPGTPTKPGMQTPKTPSKDQKAIQNVNSACVGPAKMFFHDCDPRLLNPTDPSLVSTPDASLLSPLSFAIKQPSSRNLAIGSPAGSVGRPTDPSQHLLTRSGTDSQLLKSASPPGRPSPLVRASTERNLMRSMPPLMRSPTDPSLCKHARSHNDLFADLSPASVRSAALSPVVEPTRSSVPPMLSHSPAAPTPPSASPRPPLPTPADPAGRSPIEVQSLSPPLNLRTPPNPLVRSPTDPSLLVHAGTRSPNTSFETARSYMSDRPSQPHSHQRTPESVASAARDPSGASGAAQTTPERRGHSAGPAQRFFYDSDPHLQPSPPHGSVSYGLSVSGASHQDASGASAGGMMFFCDSDPVLLTPDRGARTPGSAPAHVRATLLSPPGLLDSPASVDTEVSEGGSSPARRQISMLRRLVLSAYEGDERARNEAAIDGLCGPDVPLANGQAAAGGTPEAGGVNGSVSSRGGKGGKCLLPRGLLERAERGNSPDAQFEAGARMHFLLVEGAESAAAGERREGFEVHDAYEGEALDWYYRATKENHPWAFFALGVYHLRPKGKEEGSEDDVAFALLKAAADQGLAEAQWYVGLMMLVGDGTKKRESKAIQMLHKAADKGHKGALSDLVVCYLTGWGTSVDAQKGRALMRRAKSAEVGPLSIPSYFPLSLLPRPPGHVAPKVPYLLSEEMLSRINRQEDSEEHRGNTSSDSTSSERSHAKSKAVSASLHSVGREPGAGREALPPVPNAFVPAALEGERSPSSEESEKGDEPRKISL